MPVEGGGRSLQTLFQPRHGAGPFTVPGARGRPADFEELASEWVVTATGGAGDELPGVRVARRRAGPPVGGARAVARPVLRSRNGRRTTKRADDRPGGICRPTRPG